jgi:hypothetical protein
LSICSTVYFRFFALKTQGQQLVQTVLALAAAGDLDMLSDVLGGEDLALARELAELVDNFDYANSIAFETLTKGKSAAVLNAQRKRISEPVKRRELRDAFYQQVRSILQDGQVENYLSKEDAGAVSSIRSRLRELIR